MDEITTYLTGTGLALVISLTVVLYLRKNLLNLLTDVCGTESRANFWMSISNICLVLVPFMLALTYKPDMQDNVIFELSRNISRSLFGLIGTIIFISLSIGLFIPRSPAHIQTRKTS